MKENSKMKCTIPEISWHNRDPVLSVDIQPGRNNKEGPYRLASGGTDSHVVIWYISQKENGVAEIEFASDLQRHQRAVNVVRFSPTGELLASGDDESVIIIWKQKTDQDAPELPSSETEGNREYWFSMKTLRGHLNDVYDLSWSMDSTSLISGSVDNSAIIWDVQKGKSLRLLKEHTGFVQGVTWDPKNQYVATMCSDRSCRIYSLTTKKVVHHINKAVLPVPDGSELEGKRVRLFHDDTLKSYFRRLCFSPDGELLIVPSGFVEVPESDKHFNATFVFTRRSLNRPVLYLPSQDQYTIAVRCCPVLFQLHEGDSIFALPYRIVIAVATQSCVMLYDTQQAEPIALISNIHYTRLTDISWSDDGLILIVSSTDGYCSVITFPPGELGDVYQPSDTASDCESQQIQNSKPVSKTNDISKEKNDTEFQENVSDHSPPLDESVISESDSSMIENKNIEKDNLADITKLCENKCKTVLPEEEPSSDHHSISPNECDIQTNEKVISSKDLRNSRVRDEEIAAQSMEVDNEPIDVDSKIKEQNEGSVIDPGTSSKIVDSVTVCSSQNDRLLGSTAKVDNPSLPVVDKESENCSITIEPSATANGKKLDESVAKCKNSVTQVEEQRLEDEKTQSAKTYSSPPPHLAPSHMTPGSEKSKKTPRRVQLITLSSPKSKKKLIH